MKSSDGKLEILLKFKVTLKSVSAGKHDLQILFKGQSTWIHEKQTLHLFFIC